MNEEANEGGAAEAAPPDFARRRGLVAALAALVAVLAAAGIVALVSGGDSEDGAPQTATAPQRPAVDAARRTTNAAIGASIARPAGWRASSDGDALVIRSPDRTAVLGVSERDGGTASALLRTGVDAARRSYTNVRPLPGGGGRVAGRRAVSVVLEGVNRRDVRVRILLAGVQGRGKAWLVEVLATVGTRRLAEAQLALGTLTLSG